MSLPKAQSWLGAAQELLTFPRSGEISSHQAAPGPQGNRGEITEDSIKIFPFLAAILPVNLLLASKWSKTKRK